MKLSQIHEAAYANQVTGIYLVTLSHSKFRRIRQPVYDKKNKVLLMFARFGKDDDTVKIAVFGSDPYERLRRFVDQYFDEQLDDHDFGVSSILDKSRNYRPRPQRNFGDLEGHFKQIYNALERAKSI